MWTFYLNYYDKLRYEVFFSSSMEQVKRWKTECIHFISFMLFMVQNSTVFHFFWSVLDKADHSGVISFSSSAVFLLQ